MTTGYSSSLKQRNPVIGHIIEDAGGETVRVFPRSHDLLVRCARRFGVEVGTPSIPCPT